MELKDKQFTVGATLEGFSLLKDGGASLRFHTGELAPEAVNVIKAFFGGFGWLLFKENQLSPEDIPTEDADFEGKSPSKRLRAVVYVFWEARGKQGDFEAFYRQQIERVIDYFKTKLPPQK